MNSSLEKRFARLQGDLTSLLEEIKEHSNDRLNRKPSPEAWSVLQVMHHLMLAEQLSLGYVKKKLSFNPELKNAGFTDSMRLMIIKTYLGSPFKVKAPEGVGDEVLPAESKFWETAKNWKEQRAELKDFLENMPDGLEKKAIYKHPVAGRLSLNGMLGFYESHFKRHRKQIRRILD